MSIEQKSVLDLKWILERVNLQILTKQVWIKLFTLVNFLNVAHLEPSGFLFCIKKCSHLSGFWDVELRYGDCRFFILQHFLLAVHTRYYHYNTDFWSKQDSMSVPDRKLIWNPAICIIIQLGMNFKDRKGCHLVAYW